MCGCGLQAHKGHTPGSRQVGDWSVKKSIKESGLLIGYAQKSDPAIG